MRKRNVLTGNAEQVEKWLKEGVSHQEIADRMGVGRTAVSNHAKKIGISFDRVCAREDCGKSFVTTNATQLYCSKQCAKRVSYRNVKGLEVERKLCKMSEYGECENEIVSVGGHKDFCCKACSSRYEYLKNNEEIYATGLACEVCGETLTFDFHHIVPRAEGGADDPSNITVLCPTHHTAIHRSRATLSKDGIYRVKYGANQKVYYVRTLAKIGVPKWFDKYMQINRPD